MKIISGYIDWCTYCHNSPDIHVKVDRIPDLSEYRYEKRGPLYFAELDGAVSLFFYDGPSTGYYGRSYKLTMKDGSKEILLGPWSSGSYATNEAGFTPSAEITVEYSEHSLIACIATIGLIQEALDNSTIELRDYLPHPQNRNPMYNSKMEFPKDSRVEMRISEHDMVKHCYTPHVIMPDGSVFEKFAFLESHKDNLQLGY